jgi:hypothetical protein
MSFLKKIGTFYINAHIHVSLAASCMVFITGIVFRTAVLEVSIFVGFSTLLSYNIIRFLKYKSFVLNQNSSDWFERNKWKVWILMCVSFFGALYMLLFLETIALLVLLPFVLIVMLYMAPVFPDGISKRTLRNLPFVKIFSISLTWSGVTVIFPLMNSGVTMDRVVWFFFLYQFLFVFIWTLPFDIRDIAHDAQGMKTIPQILGVKRTKRLGMILLILMSFLPFHFIENSVFVLVPTGLLFLMVALWSSKVKQAPFYASFWVESIPIWQFILFVCTDL